MGSKLDRNYEHKYKIQIDSLVCFLVLPPFHAIQMCVCLFRTSFVVYFVYLARFSFFCVVCHVHWSQYESGNVWIFANRFRYFFGVIFWCANKSNNNNTVLLICFTRTINYFNDASDRTKCNKPPTKQKKKYNTHIHTHLMRNERAICSKKDDLLLCVSHLPIILVMNWIASKRVELANETTRKIIRIWSHRSSISIGCSI